MIKQSITFIMMALLLWINSRVAMEEASAEPPDGLLCTHRWSVRPIASMP